MRKGGRYTRDGGGEPKLVERTEEHSDGNRARDADGRPIPAKGRASAPAPAAAKPARAKKE